jgi:hypothetical protein
MKASIATLLLFASLGAASAQAPASQASGASKPAATAHKPAAALRAECVLAVGLCVTIPASWQRLGDVFDDLGFVVAEPHPGDDPASWPQLTVAAIDVPPQKGATGTAPSLDSLVDIALTPDGSFTSAETLQRTHLLLNQANAEIVRVQLHEAADKPGAIEDIALIQGDDGLVYSIALRCAPREFTRLEPVFQKAARSWRIKPPAAQPAPSSKLKQNPEKK